MPRPRLVRRGPGVAEWLLGRHPELFFAVHRLDFEGEAEEDTAGRFHVLNLVEGEAMEIVTSSGDRHPLAYAETVMVPAAVGPLPAALGRPTLQGGEGAGGGVTAPLSGPLALALDVGGSTVSGGIVSLEDGAVLGGVEHLEIGERAGEGLVHLLAGLLAGLRSRAGEGPVAAGVAMPGPFDYRRGISRMEHKLIGLRGMELRPPLEAVVGVPVRFCNDATAFALGPWWRRFPAEARLVGVTIGTGLGCGFVVEGEPAARNHGLPPGGEIWDRPYWDGILEEAVSRRALEGHYARSTGREIGVEEMAELARRGDQAARSAFRLLGEALGEGLALEVIRFRPTRIVVGGQIAKAFDLFGEPAGAAYRRVAGTAPPFSPAEVETLALSGVGRFLLLPEPGG
ncbi:MAG: ROK family protein [Actinomycetota bacterium]|nr:ROK family protein [Actinomycetota bacterium]